MTRVPVPSIDKIPGGRGYASLSRRVRTLIIAGVQFVALFALTLTLPVPYVILTPGPTYNTLGTDGKNQIVMLIGRKAAATTGNLNMTTVSVTTQRVNAFQAITGWLLHDQVVVPETAVKRPGESQQEVNQQNSADFAQSQDNATAAALCEMHYPKAFGVIDVKPGGPSDNVLAPGDALVSVDGAAADTSADLAKVLAAESPGRTVPVLIKRQSPNSQVGVPETVRVKLGKPAAGSKGARLGITVTTGCLAPFTIDLGLGNQIGGPSAGLMFALGIIDKVGLLGDLTGGKFIAGTGTISPDGTVGPIGGIALKMIAARDKGATVFLAPAGNCDEVRSATPAGLQVIKVDTLHHAVGYLDDLKAGKPVPHC